MSFVSPGTTPPHQSLVAKFVSSVDPSLFVLYARRCFYEAVLWELGEQTTIPGECCAWHLARIACWSVPPHLARDSPSPHPVPGPQVSAASALRCDAWRGEGWAATVPLMSTKTVAGRDILPGWVIRHMFESPEGIYMISKTTKGAFERIPCPRACSSCACVPASMALCCESCLAYHLDPNSCSGSSHNPLSYPPSQVCVQTSASGFKSSDA